ncbi:hypothetical protein ACLTEW_06740 [Gordonia lacunae]
MAADPRVRRLNLDSQFFPISVIRGEKATSRIEKLVVVFVAKYMITLEWGSNYPVHSLPEIVERMSSPTLVPYRTHENVVPLGFTASEPADANRSHDQFCLTFWL